MSRYLSYSALTAAEKEKVGNGCGPSWMPEKIKAILFDWLFEAQCAHHDFGYIVGGNERRRWHCDWLFFRAMIRDSLRDHWHCALYRLPVACVFYACVMLGGWASFRYRAPIKNRAEFFGKNIKS